MTEPATDEVDFATFVRVHSTALLRAALLLTGDRNSAEELLQDTFVRLYPRWSKVAAADVPLAYVRRSLANNFINDKRRRSAKDVLLADPPDRGYEPDIAGQVTDRDLVTNLLDTLAPRPRAVLVLRFFEDLSDEQIAADLGCRRGTVRSIISRGLAALRAETDRRSDNQRTQTNGTR